MSPTLHVVSDPDSLGAVAGSILVDALRAAIRSRGLGRLAIPGGRSPRPVFDWLAAHLPAEVAAKTIVTWVDERHVPQIELDASWSALPEASNLRGAWEAWFSRAAHRPRIVPLAHPGELEGARSAVSDRFADALGGLDVVLLGAGPDGHIASLFPDHPAGSATRAVIAVPDSPKPPPERLTLSLPVLQQVDCAVLVASGADRAAMLARAWAGDPALPLGQYQPRGAWHWVVDPAAAAHLPKDAP